MDSERWRQVDNLLQSALERPSEERDAFLRHACAGDEALEREIRSLLASHQEAGSFLESPAMELEARAIAVEWNQDTTKAAAFLIGQTISHYRLVEKVGAGGMGVVWKARDTRLGRPVALKFLPAAKMNDPERKRRFIQEARAASALNHPNIVAIYDIDQADGADFIAMEFVSGKPLARLIPRKGLALKEALQYAIQVADALAAAHAAGIVHRDLKPGNIMVNESGSVKVVDFGLAKLTEQPGAFASTETSPDTPKTEEGLILGTVSYMSPEQAEGKKVDARSDIFSFGAVLYEMVTGRHAFTGGSTASILSAILRDEPKPLSKVVQGVPDELEEIIGLCLRKDPNKRLQHMDDLKLVLENIKEHCDAGRPVGASANSPKRRYRWMTITGLTALAAALGIWWMAKSGVPDAAPTLTRLTWESGLTEDPVLSADGKLVAYASDRYEEGNLDICVRQLSGGEPIRLTSHPADDVTPSFSPDSVRIAFHSDRDNGGVYVVSALGGQERFIARGGQNPRFSPDGDWIVYWVGEPNNFAPSARAHIVPAMGGKPVEFQSGFADVRYPVWTPDGKHILFQGQRSPQEEPDWWVAPVEGAGSFREQPVKTGAFEVFRRRGLSVHMGPGGFQDEEIVFSANAANTRSLYEVPISNKSWKVVATPRRLTFGTGLDVEPFPGPDGRLVFESLNITDNLWLLPIHEQGRTSPEIRGITHGPAFHDAPSCSRDGRSVVFTCGRVGDRDVWLKDLVTGREEALTVTRSDEFSPVISADGSKVAYSRSGAPTKPIYIIGSTPGSSVPVKVCDNCGEPVGWSPDGSKILYVYGHPSSVGIFNLPSGWQTRLLHARYSLEQAQFSPDGVWISIVAYTGPNQTRVYVLPFRDGAEAPEDQWIPITDGRSWDDLARWSPDGNTIYFYSKRDGFGCIWKQDLDRKTKRPVGAPSAVHHFHSSRVSMMHVGLRRLGIAAAPGKLIFNLLEQTANLWMMETRRQK